MGKLLHWFYCLPMEQAALVMLLGALAFRGMMHRWGKNRTFGLMTAGVFALWLAALVYTTLGNRDGGQYTVSLAPFHSYREVLAGGNIEILRSNFMNGALFFPGGVLLGALLPRRWPLWGKLILGTLLLGAVSVGVEYVQYARSLGRVEIDDVIHNVLGAILGIPAVNWEHRSRK